MPRRHRKLEEPDVTPLINVNLVILVMTLAIASHAAKLLPLAVPKAKDNTTYIGMDEAVVLTVSEKGRYSLAGGSELDAEALGAAVKELPADSIVLVSAHPKAKYGSLVSAVDHLIERPGLRVAFGHPPAAAAKTPAAKGGPAPKTPAPTTPTPK